MPPVWKHYYRPASPGPLPRMGWQTHATGVPDRRLPRGSAGVDDAGFSSPARPRLITAESADERRGCVCPEYCTQKCTGSQTDVRIFAHPTCALLSCAPLFSVREASAIGRRLDALRHNLGTEGADLKSLREGKSPPALGALLVHDFLIGRFAG